MSDEFSTQYDPKSFEDSIYQKWESSGVFHSTPDATRKPYTIPIPPPNVTGVLHIGHALNNSLQDFLIRFRRMQGFETLWMPGTDHAGIATQNVVEKQIAKSEQKNRYQIGRSELIKRIWQWKEQSGGTILKQLRKLGATCDWERTRFTMDEGLSKAVRHAFVKLYEKQLIYRRKYLVNWCARCRTTLSDDEVEHADVKGKMHELRYALVSATPATIDAQRAWEDAKKAFDKGPGKDGVAPADPGPQPAWAYITVATTRPETLFGDTAVAVHPKDDRYTSLVGQKVKLPLTEREIPIIADDVAVELGFGTGCLKVTPAHDTNDYQTGLRNKLEQINILTESGLLNEKVPAEFRGLDRVKGREKTLADLKAQGLLGEVKDHLQKVGHCYRCNSVVEPFLTSQWFVKMKPLSELAIKATSEGRVKFHPERWTKVYLKWFEEVRDWPVSRQIWWGHQIPVWYDLDENKDAIIEIEAGEGEPFDREANGKKYRYVIGENAKPIVSIADPDTLPEYKGKRLLRDPDVLDTWFSSALWPFSTLGWPDKTPELDYYYPTSTLVTSRGIIYFWVARMVMMGEAMLNKQPFNDVVIHGTVLDGDGEVMSKSKGNGIDPLDVINRYGADAIRFTMADLSTGGQDIKFPVQIVCPHCNEAQELPKKRSVPVMACKKCKQEFQQPVPNEPPQAEPQMGPLDSARFEKGRNFANKVWNAARYVITSIEAAGGAPKTDFAALSSSLRAEDRWILSRMNSTVQEVTEALEHFEFSRSIGALYEFFWNEFCAWYIELSKPRLAAGNDAKDREAAASVLLYVLDRSLRLLQPFCPYVTEALWSELGTRASTSARNLGRGEYKAGQNRHQESGQLAVAAWPQPEKELIDSAQETLFASVFDSVIAIRSVRQQLIDNAPKERKKDVGAAVAVKFQVAIRTPDAAIAKRLKEQEHILIGMADIEAPQVGADIASPKPAAATAIKGGMVYVALPAGLVDIEKLRLEKEIKQAEQYIPKIEVKLKNENFIKNAPPELVAEERAKLHDAGEKLKTLRAALAEL